MWWIKSIFRSFPILASSSRCPPPRSSHNANVDSDQRAIVEWKLTQNTKTVKWVKGKKGNRKTHLVSQHYRSLLLFRCAALTNNFKWISNEDAMLMHVIVVDRRHSTFICWGVHRNLIFVQHRFWRSSRRKRKREKLPLLFTEFCRKLNRRPRRCASIDRSIRAGGEGIDWNGCEMTHACAGRCGSLDNNNNNKKRWRREEKIAGARTRVELHL